MMDAMPDSLESTAGQFSVEALLEPLSPQAPCGPALRYDPVFTEIRLLREEDDPSLPMGQWERPLKRADWPRIESKCAEMLAMRSKHLQIAVWLVESWMRQRGFAGLLQGMRLLDALLHRYWLPLHPVIDQDDGGADARLAPLEWLNESLSSSVRLHAAMLTLELNKATAVTLAQWERMTAQEMAAPEKPARAGPVAAAPELTRADVAAAAQLTQDALEATGAAVSQCLAHLHSIIGFLHAQLEEEPPNLGKLESTLEAVLRVLAQLAPAPAIGGAAFDEAIDGDQAGTVAQPGAAGMAVPESGADAAVRSAPAAAVEAARWGNRREAYVTLEALADYLSEVEPHSPTPFLIRRAVRWGRMSLPEVIVEIMQEDGNLGGLLNVLGIKTHDGS